ncbi:MAG: hypothetical protein ACRD4I_08210, partial [Candidatus Angelobacter sp.]
MRNIILAALLVCGSYFVQATNASTGEKNTQSGTPAAAESSQARSSAAVTPATPADLQRVLAQMNRAAATFKTAQADFVWEQYQKVVDETDTQRGTMYLKRTKNGMDAALRITSPDVK